MSRRLRTRWPALFGLLLAALTLLPPGGWALCVAPGGHVGFEPVALEGTGCCSAPAGDAAAGVTSDDSDCDSCTDLAMFDGSLSPGRAPQWSASLVALASLSCACVTPVIARARAHRATAAPPPSSARRTGTLLRN